MAYPAALEIVKERVKPVRRANPDRSRREHWWLHGRPGTAFRAAITGLTRYITGTRVGKRILFAWADTWACPSDATNAFAFDDYFHLGVLNSRVHMEWARAQSSTLRVDIRYTPTSAFETFPWPAPTGDQSEAIAAAARAMIARRDEICVERQIGLTKLYNEVDDGAYQDLRKLHRELDEAVGAAYGWPKSASHNAAEANRRLLELNQRIAAGEVEYAPFPEPAPLPS